MSDHESESKELPPDYLSTEPKDLTAHPGVLKQIDILQNMIARMNANSMSCKTWCAALVSAVLVASSKEDNILLIGALLPVIFLFLDTTYLAMERNIRNEIYKPFILKMHNGEIIRTELFQIDLAKINHKKWLGRWKSIWSWSVGVFYLPLIALMVIICFYNAGKFSF